MSTIRFCSHCGKALTDAVSLDCGVGPVCRGIENEVLAKSLPVNEAALAKVVPTLLLAVPRCAPETQDVLTEILTAVLSVGREADLRKTVKRLDWCCSYAQPVMARDAMIALIAALGYPGLAGIVAGKSSTTAAEVTAVGGRIVVKGAKNAYASECFKKIPGWAFDYKVSKTWSFPGTAAEAVKLAIYAAYPATPADLAKVGAEAVAQAAALATSIPAPVAPKAPAPIAAPKSTVTPVVMTVTDKAVLLKTAALYPMFVSELKTLPVTDRAWNLPSAPGCWTVAKCHEAFCKALIAKHFPSAATAAA